MKPKTLKWKQVNAWRLSQHCLSPRLKRKDYIPAVERTVGIQAQVLSAAGQALWARVEGLTRRDVQAALWEKRSLVKTWAMRGALHLISASELPLYAAARSLHGYDWTNYFAYYGIGRELMELYLRAAPEVLGSQPMRREQYAAAMLKHTGSEELFRLIQAKSWGTPMKPLAWSGELCFGPSQGQNITFVNPRKWLGGWEPVDPQEAWLEIGRRYLRTYGPANPENFFLWWGGGSGLRAARKLFKSLEPELERVSVEGWEAYALRSTLEPLQKLKPSSGTVNLLPLFDAYVLGLGRHAELEPHLPAAHHPRVFRPQGWISPVILVDGNIKGVWEAKIMRGRTALQVEMLAPLTPRIRRGIESEAERLGSFLGGSVTVEYV